MADAKRKNKAADRGGFSPVPKESEDEKTDAGPLPTDDPRGRRKNNETDVNRPNDGRHDRAEQGL